MPLPCPCLRTKWNLLRPCDPTVYRERLFDGEVIQLGCMHQGRRAWSSSFLDETGWCRIMLEGKLGNGSASSTLPRQSAFILSSREQPGCSPGPASVSLNFCEVGFSPKHPSRRSPMREEEVSGCRDAQLTKSGTGVVRPHWRLSIQTVLTPLASFRETKNRRSHRPHRSKSLKSIISGFGPMLAMSLWASLVRTQELPPAG